MKKLKHVNRYSGGDSGKKIGEFGAETEYVDLRGFPIHVGDVILQLSAKCSYLSLAFSDAMFANVNMMDIICHGSAKIDEIGEHYYENDDNGVKLIILKPYSEVVIGERWGESTFDGYNNYSQSLLELVDE